MKIKFVLLMSLSFFFTACNTGNKTPESTTAEEVTEALGALSGTGAGVIMEDEWVSLFDGETRGVPILSCLGVLNDNYEGGDFIICEDKRINFKTGDLPLIANREEIDYTDEGCIRKATQTFK